jgi:hypothetical protein
MPRTALSGVFEDDMEIDQQGREDTPEEDPLIDFKISILPTLKVSRNFCL